MRRQALFDQLTGLPNRVLLRDRLSRALAQADREEAQFALIVLGLDRFKEVNDTLGHHRGDELLRSVSQHLASVMRNADTIARLGGDEFAVLLTRTEGALGAIAAADRAVRSLGENYLVAGIPVHVGVSVGIVVFPDHGRQVDVLLQHADVAMQRAKEAGLDHAVYAADQDPHDARLLSLAADLRGAISAGQFELHYQPQYQLGDAPGGTLLGVEALIRWRHPTRGLISPEIFVPLAERIGMIRPLTTWILREGLHQLRSWHDTGLTLSMALNISPRSLTDGGFVSDMTTDSASHSIVRATIALAHNLGFTVVAEGVEDAETLRSLRDLGCDEVQGFYLCRPRPASELALELARHSGGGPSPVAPRSLATRA